MISVLLHYSLRAVIKVELLLYSAPSSGATSTNIRISVSLLFLLFDTWPQFLYFLKWIYHINNKLETLISSELHISKV
jgi:hypothetical protein